MGKVRNAANTVRIGRIGENTWYVRDGIQIVRQRLNNSNFGEGARRTRAQQVRRVVWGNLVNVWKVLQPYLQSAFENKKQGQSDYNIFMSLNADNSSIYLTRTQLEAGASVPGGYWVSKGSLTPFGEVMAVDQVANKAYVLMNWGDASITTPTSSTWGALSSALIAANPDVMNGDNIAFLTVGFRVGEDNVPRMYVGYKELALNTADGDSLEDHELPLNQVEGIGSVMEIVVPTGVTPVGGCIIRTRLDGGLKVSSQHIVQAYDDAAAEYRSDEQLEAAIKELGIDSDVILAPGD